jgi:hypothetical protein
MKPPSDREPVPVLSKREREQNRLLHHCSGTGRTALEQVEQVGVYPRWSYSCDQEQVGPKMAILESRKTTSCSNALRTGQNGTQTGRQGALWPQGRRRAVVDIRSRRTGTVRGAQVSVLGQSASSLAYSDICISIGGVGRLRFHHGESDAQRAGLFFLLSSRPRFF